VLLLVQLVLLELLRLQLLLLPRVLVAAGPTYPNDIAALPSVAALL